MQTVELGRTGRQVSALALGAMQMGNATGERDSITILDRYLDAGGSFIDTADCYEWWGPGEPRRAERGTARPVDARRQQAGPAVPGHQGLGDAALLPRPVGRRRHAELGPGAQDLLRRRRGQPAARAGRQPAAAGHRSRRPLLHPRRRPGHPAGGDSGGPGRVRPGRQGPVPRVVERTHLADGADPATVRAARLAGAGGLAATALVPAAEGGQRQHLHRRPGTARLPARARRPDAGRLLADPQGDLRRPGQAARALGHGELHRTGRRRPAGGGRRDRRRGSVSPRTRWCWPG